MALIPFIYFTSLLVYVYSRHKAYDVACYVISLYVVTSLCAVLLQFFDLYETAGYLNYSHPSLLASCSYCILLTVALLPFIRLKTSSIHRISLRKKKLFKGICYGAFMVFLLTLFFVSKEIPSILARGIEERRADFYNGDIENFQSNLSGIAFALSWITNIFKFFSPLMLLFFFYSITYMNNSLSFNLMLFLSTLSQPIYAVINVDRTNFVYYLLMFCFCYVLFKDKFSASLKNKVKIFLLVIVSVFALYIAIVSIARFNDRDGGVWGSVLRYAGQPYMNFCYFFDCYDNVHKSFVRIFPMTHHFLFEKEYGREYMEYVFDNTGFFIGIFSTFLGDWMIDLGKSGMVCALLLFSFMSYFFLREGNFQSEVDFSWCIKLFIFISVPIFGIFYYRYYSYSVMFYCLFSMFMALVFRYNINYGTNRIV
ncbi:MAG: oligosaccharide repeat unit polymerase [bacterium]|uniref:Oligosaccharide repeat unit polymerase n=1 Tax=Candidatus Aphodosoma intestinipullorum TaxID=2840674 RepID=A0A940DNF7_9BACT|nr:oligosaccharide repeat unit polymerase [Candidatus Aphodosoma intestinipullorum]